MTRFADKVALVTGAGAGMGLDTAGAFATAGAAVVLADVNENALRTATDELTAAGHQALGVTCDADEEQVAALVDRTVAEVGRLESLRRHLQERITASQGHAAWSHPTCAAASRACVVSSLVQLDVHTRKPVG